MKLIQELIRAYLYKAFKIGIKVGRGEITRVTGVDQIEELLR